MTSKSNSISQRCGESLADIAFVGETRKTGANEDVDDVGSLSFGAVEMVGTDLVELLHAPRPHNGGNAA